MYFLLQEYVLTINSNLGYKETYINSCCFMVMPNYIRISSVSLWVGFQQTYWFFFSQQRPFPTSFLKFVTSQC